MISCKKVTELISKSMDEPLSSQEQLALKVHLFVCEWCEQFRKQMKVVGTVLKGGREAGAKSLSSEAKAKILQALQDESQRE